MNEAFIALGTNIEPREGYLRQALESLSEHEKITIQKKSSIYETAPVGYVDQAHFLNMVIRVESTLTPIKLLDACQEIEHKLGRKRTIDNGPRTIDLDILVYNQEDIQTDRLTIPHPRMRDRAFVLIPFVEIAPHLSILIEEKPHYIKDLLNNLSSEDKNDVLAWPGNK